MSVLHRLSRPGLQGLADDLESGRLSSPYHVVQLRHYAPESCCEDLRAWLDDRRREGLSSTHAAMFLRLLAEERQAAQQVADRAQLVWSGMDVPGAKTRETRVVVQELFARARRSVLVSTFALDYGEKGQQVFGGLAARMDDVAELDVKLYVNIHRQEGHGKSDEELCREFSERFRHDLWAGHRLPEVYYYPQSLRAGGDRHSLHAKCVVVDGEHVLVTSANFTEAAQQRNIEAGVVTADTALAGSLRVQFNALTERRVFKRLL
jgi:phosphatidylserine/phosphatidylglycerophosphate/cardiolipin synthase-like enzyme